MQKAKRGKPRLDSVAELDMTVVTTVKQSGIDLL
jgi:hypothetical protein